MQSWTRATSLQAIFNLGLLGEDETREGGDGHEVVVEIALMDLEAEETTNMVVLLLCLKNICIFNSIFVSAW